MKALVLTIHPRLERPRTGAEIMPFREQWRAERELRLTKRLTDAELAAEYNGQMCRVLTIEEGSRLGSAGPSAYRKLETLHRFATLPHYDEAPATNDTTGTL